MIMMVTVTDTEDRQRQQQRPKGDGSTDGDGGYGYDNDNILVIREVRTLMSGSIPNLSGAAAATSTHNDDVSGYGPQNPLEDEDDESDEEAPRNDDLVPIDDDYVDNDNNNNELQSLHRPSSTTTTSESDKRRLPEDTFSFLIYSPVLSRTFFWAIFVFLFQMAIYAVLAYDITNPSNKENPFKLPANVDIPVRVAEALAIVVAIITQDNLHHAMNLIRDVFGYQDLANAFPGATILKWTLSVILRATEGSLGLFITFLLIMQSTTVLDLLLNFLAMEFVSQLDGMVFVLAREGYFGRNLQEEAKKVSNTFYHVVHDRSAELVVELDHECKEAFGVLYFVILFTGCFAAWGWIFLHQVDDKYLCEQIFVQYGDEVVPMLGTFSGLFHKHSKTFGGRLSYRDKSVMPIRDLQLADDRVGGPFLAYCTNEKRWTLSLTKDGVGPDDWNPCDWYAASSETEDFDVVTTANIQWVIKTPTKGVVPVSQHFMACYDCRFIDNLCGDFGKCITKRGLQNQFGKTFFTFRVDVCECGPGHYGLRCEYPGHCPRLEINQHGKSLVKASGEYFASKYYLLEGATTYNRPVYTSLDPWGDEQVFAPLPDDVDFDIILFTGVRWILSHRRLFPELKDVKYKKSLGSYFSRFHGHFTNYSTSFVSGPVYVGSHQDDEASPFGLRWMYSSASDNAFDQRLQPDLQRGFIETSFFCAVCNNTTNRCPRGAVCQSNGTCGGCPNDFSGTMCQIPPDSSGNLTISNGK